MEGRRGYEDVKVWTPDYTDLVEEICHAAEALGVGDFMPHYMRHAGTARDAAAGGKNLNETQRTGRRRSRRSVGRYEKAGQRAEGSLKLQTGARKKIQRCEANLAQVFGRTKSAPR